MSLLTGAHYTQTPPVAAVCPTCHHCPTCGRDLPQPFQWLPAWQPQPWITSGTTTVSASNSLSGANIRTAAADTLDPQST